MMRARSVRFLIALLALAGWANARAMACCWLPDARAAVASVFETDEEVRSAPEAMAADHSCCAGASVETSSVPAAAPGDGERSASSAPCDVASGVAAPCCESGDDAVPSLASASPDIPAGTVVLTEHRLQVAPATTAPSFGISGEVLSDGSPPFLALRRLLI